MTLPVVFTANGASTYNLTKSLRFRSSASAYLNRTPSTAGNRQVFTYSAWVKRGLSSSGQDRCLLGTGTAVNSGNGVCEINFSSDNVDSIRVWQYLSGVTWRLETNAVFRDYAGWYHIVVAVDTTQATASNRVKIYVNGVQQTSFYIATYPSQNYNTGFNSTDAHNISRRPDGSNYYDGYQAEVNFVDGQALTPSSFGSTNATTGVWQPAKYTGTYGTNGFYLPFTNTTSTTTLGYDFSGNSNNWTTNNLSLTAGTTYDSMTDVPTLTSATTANYCVLNPIDNRSSATISDGNLTFNTGTASAGLVVGTIAASSGKWYVEFTPTSSVANECFFGIENIAFPLTSGDGYVLGNNATSYAYRNSGQKVNNGSSSSYGASFTTNDIIGVALDLDAGTLTFYKNNTSQGTAFTGITGTYRFGSNDGTGAGAITGVVNFGQQPFTYTPPTGFVALNTYNLPTSTIVKGNTVMDATLYTGTGASLSVVNTAGFKPDFVWQKCRSTAYQNNVWDSVRGVAYTLVTNGTYAENPSGSSDFVSFNSNGFTVNQTANYELSHSGSTYVAWQWQAGQGTTSTNTSGSLTSTVSVNASAGFSVVTYSIAVAVPSISTFGHGLGVAPSMVILKVRNAVDEWTVYHSALSAPTTSWLTLNTTAAVTGSSSTFSSSSSTFGVRDTRLVGVGGSGNIVAYCFAEIAGFSKFGSYTGANNTGASTPNANGPFVYTGFRPKFVLIKRTSSAADWEIYDSVRGPYNANYPWLQPNTSSAEASSEAVDFLSNGFKIRSESGATMYPDGATFIYMAFAENPFKNALAR
jgi:hypothetical protein